MQPTTKQEPFFMWKSPRRKHKEQDVTATYATITQLTTEAGHGLICICSKLSDDLILKRKEVMWDCQTKQERNARRHRQYDTKTDRGRLYNQNKGWSNITATICKYICWPSCTIHLQKATSAMDMRILWNLPLLKTATGTCVFVDKENRMANNYSIS